MVRIIKDLKDNISPILMYTNLAHGRRHESIPDDEFCNILDLIWHRDGGQEVAIDLLSMRFHGLKQKQDYIVSDCLKKKSASLLALFDYSKERNHFNSKDYNFTQIANVCFSNKVNEDYAISVFMNIRDSILDHIIGRMDLPDFLSTMIQMHPILALEVFIGEGVEVEPQLRNAIKNRFDNKTSPFSNMEAQNILEWCDDSRENRYPKLASIITPYQFIEESIEWTPLAIEVLKNSPEPIKVLEEYLSSLHSSSGSGSRAQKLESRLPLFQILKKHDNKKISSWAINKEVQWKKFIASEYEREVERDIDRGERFEW
ncbi:MAG: hypothetical protein ACI843_002728 [Psychrobacter glaciei]|jgi:hypothetical protein